MSNEIDDDIIDVQAPEKETDVLQVSGPSNTFSRIFKPTLETARDFSVGAAKGLTAGSMDEIGGGVSAALESLLGYIPGTSAYQTREVDEKLKAQGFNVPEEDIWDKYRGYQQASEQAQKESEERSPYANLAGQIAGSATGGALLGPALGLGTGAAKVKSISDIAKDSGKAKAALELLTRGATSYAKATPLMAAEAAFTSENQLFGEDANRSGLASDVGTSLAFGLPAMLGIQATSELAGPAIKAVGKKLGAPIESAQQKVMTALQDENNPRLRQMYKSYKVYGKELGINPRSHGAEIGPGGFAQNDIIATNTVLDKLEGIDTKLGQEVGDSLKKATERGALIDIDPNISAAAKRINDLVSIFPELGSSNRSERAYDKIMNGMSKLTPVELKNLIDDIDSSIGIFKSATNLDPKDASTLKELLTFRSSISDSLKKNVVEYRDTASRFEGFRNVLEQVISRDTPSEVTQKFYGKLKNKENDLYRSIVDMVQNVQNPSASSGKSKTSFSNFMKSLDEFKSANPEKANELIDIPALRSFILDASDDSVLRDASKNVMQSRGVMPDLKEMVIGKAQTTGTYLAGKTVKKIEGFAQKPIIKGTSDFARRIYNAPAQSLTNIASKLETTGKFKSLGKALRESVESGNTYKKNAALFTIMQTPNARILINDNDLESTEYDTDTTKEP